MNNMTIKNILITGAPGVGKTTLIKKLADALNDFNPAGFYTAQGNPRFPKIGYSHDSY